MHALRQKCRPKHQVLILNCYPRIIKGTVDVKPNSSELSYLLYYATTRRSKVQKVGAFLEKKTASDVWRARIGNIQVTLQILAALIEKAPRDLPLYASYILKILQLIICAQDITSVESSLTAFESFCQHHDEASLSADQEYLSHYQELVTTYASFASSSQPQTDLATSAPVALRWKSAGLQAIRSLVSSEAFTAVADSQLLLIVRTLLENIWPENIDYIDLLDKKALSDDNLVTGYFSRRKTSVATVRTMENPSDANAALYKSTADADKVAEADIAALAIECLRLVFMVNNKSQIHDATSATLNFIIEKLDHEECVKNSENRATRIFKKTSSWTPVQERYIILVTAMDILVNSRLDEKNLRRQLLLSTLIDSLLKSDINLIGLSVMDVLLGLTQHLLQVLQSIRPPSPEAKVVMESQWPLNSVTETIMGSPSAFSIREKLLDKLQDCIGNLATHVYYADQISDMVAAVLWRLKPGPISNMHNSSVSAENSSFATAATNTAADVSEDVTTDGLFSFNTARIRALEAIRSIIVTSSLRKSLSGAGNLARNSVPTQVWEGTQWLLRDSDFGVRKAYVSALLTWIEHEITKTDVCVSEEKSTPSLRTIKGDPTISATNKRSLSNTTQKEKNSMKRPARTTFFELLHLAIYENALKYAESEEDIVILHLLLACLVEKLGVNAVKNGLPMIFRLQEDISGAISPLAKVRLGSLCHGYFWILSKKFNFSSPIDDQIHREINRRKKRMFWTDKIRYPPLCLDQIRAHGQEVSQQSFLLQSFGPDALRPFTNRSQLIDLISSSYVEILIHQTASSPTSPNRTFNQSISSLPAASPELGLPEFVKNKMMSEWSPSSVIASVQESSKTVSLNGSKTGTMTKGRNYLSVNGTHRTQSLLGTHNSFQGHRNSNLSSSNFSSINGLGALKKLRRASEQVPLSSSELGRNSVTRVEQLKRIVYGQKNQSSWNRTVGNRTPSNASSESMASYAYTTSEISFNPSQSFENSASGSTSDRGLSKATSSKPRNREAQLSISTNSYSMPNDDKPNGKNNSEDLNPVPPMPSIPIFYMDETVIGQDLTSEDDRKTAYIVKNTKSENEILMSESSEILESFLNEIEVRPDGVNENVAVPPY